MFQADGLPVHESIVGLGRLRRFHAEPRRLHSHHFKLRQVIFVQINGRAREPLQLERPAHVVDMAVGAVALQQPDRKGLKDHTHSL